MSPAVEVRPEASGCLHDRRLSATAGSGVDLPERLAESTGARPALSFIRAGEGAMAFSQDAARNGLSSLSMVTHRSTSLPPSARTACGARPGAEKTIPAILPGPEMGFQSCGVRRNSLSTPGAWGLLRTVGSGCSNRSPNAIGRGGNAAGPGCEGSAITSGQAGSSCGDASRQPDSSHTATAPPRSYQSPRTMRVAGPVSRSSAWTAGRCVCP